MGSGDVYKRQGYQERVNNELVNNLANFVNRVIVLTNKYYEGIIPTFNPDEVFVSASTEDYDGFHETEMLQLHDDLQEVAEYIRNFEFRAALTQIMKISSQGNQLLQFNEPWKQIKEDPEAVKVVMNLAIQVVGALSVVVYPFMPSASERLRNLLGLNALSGKEELNLMLQSLAEGELIVKEGHKISEASHLFMKVEDEIIEKQKSKLISAAAPVVAATGVVNSGQDEKPSGKPTINFNDFTKLDIRVATIKHAEAVPKTEKLLKLLLDVAGEERTVVSGIAEHYDPADIVGLQVTLLANLAPRKLRGILSEGMILMAEDADGTLSFVAPDKEVTSGGVLSASLRETSVFPTYYDHV